MKTKESETMSHLPETTATDPVGHRLVSALLAQEERIALLVQIASRQSSIIAEGRTDTLLHLLEQRQKLIGEFSASQNAINQMAETLERDPSQASNDERARIRSLLDGISTRIEQVVKRDEADAAVLTEMKDTTGSKLRQMGDANRARGAYLKPNIEGNRFADTQG